ncbi:flavin reductase family protein [Tropicimonas sediminicola]|uniref:NADH-FMN oxidoreductase RutF, flavin reductase (DIM6/NTAB) family n=1 Tax=Tropicimonas sediminicola TaxID=1031541 RepID=A0A239KQR6_9RHOB|nr:flavin reductase family protein [Tropicimonas sediminicola]SNT19534.1 NADH-FMN oxidoreductase RutF, flavin reductase (DIM6/NTAB) family [Tropicimonas sediminicola]
MFYRPEDGHGLPHNPFSAIVSPRPIAWISTRGADGSENLAPYSFFNAVAYVPPQVMFATTGKKHDREGTKDTLANIRDTGVFAVNIVEYAQREIMNLTSGPWDKDVDEAEMAGIERAECETIPCSRVANAPATLECRLTQIVELGGSNNLAAFGEVTGIHLRDDCLRDGIFDVTRYQPLARLGYRDFTHVAEVFTMKRPGE